MSKPVSRPMSKLSVKELLGLKGVRQISFVQVARASNRYPNKLVIDIKERRPFALLNKDPLVILDKSCYVLSDINNLE